MSNTNCKKKKCGCEDQGLVTPTPCIHDNFNCPDSDPCSETFSACCVIYNKDSIYNTGFNQGDNLCNILQKISLWLTNPVCANPNAICQSPLGVYSSVVTPTTIKINWSPAGGNPCNYRVHYKKITDSTWTISSVIPITQLTETIGLLTSETTYMIKVESLCNCPDVDQTCESVTILVTTK